MKITKLLLTLVAGLAAGAAHADVPPPNSCPSSAHAGEGCAAGGQDGLCTSYTYCGTACQFLDAGTTTILVCEQPDGGSLPQDGGVDSAATLLGGTGTSSAGTGTGTSTGTGTGGTASSGGTSGGSSSSGAATGGTSGTPDAGLHNVDPTPASGCSSSGRSFGPWMLALVVPLLLLRRKKR